MSEERRRILEMLAQGKISVTDAERLMQAVGADTAASGARAAAENTSGAPPSLKYLHVHVRRNAGVDDPGAAGCASGWQGRWWARQHAYAGAGAGSGGSRAGRGSEEARQEKVQFSRDVDVRIPLSLLRSGMKLAAFMPGRTADIVSSQLKERGIDVDLSRLDATQLEDLFKNLGELTVDLDGGRGNVRITCE